MAVLFITLATISLILFLILITNVTITISYHSIKKDDHLKLQLKAWGGILKKTYEYPSIKIDPEEMEIIYQKETVQKDGNIKSHGKLTTEKIRKMYLYMKDILKSVVQLQRIMKRFLRRVRVTQLEWHTAIGTGDAAQTGTVTGLLWTVKFACVSILSNYMKVQTKPHMSLTPLFQQKNIQINFVCMFKVRVGNAILTALKIILNWKKHQHKNKPTSVKREEEQVQ